MGDISHSFGSDIDLSAGGDFLYVDGDTLTQQRIIKRLLTAVSADIWNLTYGAGLGQMVGETANVNAINNIVRSQIFQEQAVAQLPEPTVTVQAQATGVFVCTIAYTDAASGQQKILTLSIGN
jgi:hypothetical protein